MLENENKPEENEKKEDVVTIDLQPFLVPLAIIIAAIIVGLALFFGLKDKDSKDTDKETDTSETATGSTPTTPTTPTTAQPQAPDYSDISTFTKEFSTNIDDDAILGDIDTATVAIVEFSDYECPFCKRHSQQTAGDIIEKYVDTGQVVIVYRDYVAVGSHNPLATSEAIAAECVRSLSNDAKYYEYHDALYNTTTSNGQGITDDQIIELASDVGVDDGDFLDCFENEEFATEVAADQSEGEKLVYTDESGRTRGGTPKFVIGVLGDGGTVDGVLLVGAQPIKAFEAVIEEQLAR